MRRVLLLFICTLLAQWQVSAAADWFHNLQTKAVKENSCNAVHWGPDPNRYSSWTSHSNRLIPVYTFGTADGGQGVDLRSYTGENSIYRDARRLQRLYKTNVDDSVSETAEYMDQTNIYDLQLAALEAGKKHIILVVFDGMDWQTTQAASIAKLHRVAYTEGRGVGAHFQEYQADGTTQFGYMVTSPERSKAQVDVDLQEVKPSGGLAGGYNSLIAGAYPWSSSTDPGYLVATPHDGLARHAFTDSASSATSMMRGIKTYNGAVGVGPQGEAHASIAHLAQADGYRIGVATSVPFSHATPGAAYACNVSRSDFQDISRDLLGLPSISHPEQPLPGLDVVLGAGYGVEAERDSAQGENFEPGNKYVADSDLQRVNVENGGQYITAVRKPGVPGGLQLADAAHRAVAEGKRLLGLFGTGGEVGSPGVHLPYATADGNYDPAPGVDGEFEYSQADIEENPTLAEMATAALAVLSADDEPFWLMLESGDVDYANHSNNLDASIGAVRSGDAAVEIITDWVEAHSNWTETVLIVTSDHGHYLVLDRPELLVPPTHAETSAQE
jgi:alkaline phosphatase